jgi:hypothetical protein
MRIGESIIVPTYRLKLLLSDLRKTYTQYQDKEMTKAQIADSMKFEITSGNFNQKLSDLKNYGLLEGARDKFKITPLGIQIFQTGDAKLLENTIKHVPFWSYLLEKYAMSITKNDFLTELIRTAQMNETEAKNKVDGLFQEYISDIKMLTGSYTIKPISKEMAPPIKVTTIMEKSEESQTQPPPTLPKSVEKDSIKMSIQYGPHRIEIVDDLTFRFAEQMMRSIRKELIKRGVQFDTAL